MRLQSYINEDSARAKSIDEDDAINLIKKNCMKHVKGLKSKSRIDIYRGTYTSIPNGFGYLDPRQGRERVSANTYNHMTLLMDNLPSWKAYPKRGRSVICSVSANIAENFGEAVYYVYPYDKCKIGIVPDSDIWAAFEALGVETVENFTIFLNRLDISDKSWNTLKQDLSEVYDNDTVDQYDLHILDMKSVKEAIDLTIRQYGHWAGYSTEAFDFFANYVKKVVNEYAKTGKRPAKNSFIKNLDYELSPRSNDFALGFPSSKHKDNEVWIGNAPMILVINDKRHTDALKDEGLL